MTRPTLTHTCGDGDKSSCPECRLMEIEGEIVRTGSDDQVKAWIAGRLPEDELLALARRRIYEPLDVMARWKMLKPEECRHEPDCPGVKAIEFSTTFRVRMNRAEWNTLSRITELAAEASEASEHHWLHGERFSVDVKCHLATCMTCHAETDGISAVVSVSWAGRRLSREYAL